LEKGRLEKQIERQNAEVKELSQKAVLAAQEKQSIKEMLGAQMLESKNYRDLMLQLSGELEEKDREINFLNSMMSDSELAKLSEKNGQLTAQLQEQTEAMAKCNRQSEIKSQSIETLKQENQILRDTIARLSTSLDEMNAQNDKLFLAGQALSDQLELEYKKSLELIREKSFLVMEKLAAARKLEVASGRIAVMEMESRKRKEGEENAALSERVHNTEPERETD
jgi:hypothetical protein